MNLSKKILAGLNLFLCSPLMATRKVAGRIFALANKLITLDRLDIFVCDPASIPPPNENVDLIVRPLSRDDFDKLRQRSDRFGEQAKLYYEKRGITSAFGIFINGEPAHISWAYTADEYAREPYERFRLRKGEAEIVNCYTAASCRGRGLYPHAIRVIAEQLLSGGFERVYMNIEPANESSRSGILKAGLREDGRIFHLRSPAFNKWRGLYLRLPPER